MPDDRAAPAAPADDLVQPFQIDGTDVHGRLVRLGPALDGILSGHDYPAPVANLLGELIVVAAATAGAFKFRGALSLQTTSNGPVPLMIAQYRAPAGDDPRLVPARLRGYARFESEAVRAAQDHGDPSQTPAQRLLGTGHIAFTVEQGPQTERHQGIIALDGPTIVESVHAYFRQSDQLDAAIRVDVGDAHDHADARPWRASGLMVQRLPGSGVLFADRPDEDWRRALALAGSIARDELLDPRLEPRSLLRRAFPEDGVIVYRPVRLQAQCRCSRERVETVLRSFPAAELADMLIGGNVTVTCEFCNRRYVFPPGELGIARVRVG